jgi:hypothetical protein
VRKAVPGLTDKLASSGIEMYQIKSLLTKTAKCKVPTKNNFYFEKKKFKQINLMIWNDIKYGRVPESLANILPTQTSQNMTLEYQKLKYPVHA